MTNSTTLANLEKMAYPRNLTISLNSEDKRPPDAPSEDEPKPKKDHKVRVWVDGW